MTALRAAYELCKIGEIATLSVEGRGDASHERFQATVAEAADMAVAGLIGSLRVHHEDEADAFRIRGLTFRRLV